MNIQDMNIDSIKPYERNPRHNDSAVDSVVASIKSFGWQQPIVVDKNNVIIVGHTRYKAAKKLKLSTVPVLVADNLTDAQVKAYRLADNKVGELAEWDDVLLNLELDDLSSLDSSLNMSDFGFIKPEGALDDYEEVDKPKEKKPKIVTCPICGETFEA